MRNVATNSSGLMVSERGGGSLGMRPGKELDSLHCLTRTACLLCAGNGAQRSGS